MKQLKAISILIATLFISSCGHHSEPETFLIPNGYQGRVTVVYNQANGANTKYEGDRRIYEIPANGILVSKFKDDAGWINQEYFYLNSSGQRTKLEQIVISEKGKQPDNKVAIFNWARMGSAISANNKTYTYQEFYVGRYSEMEEFYKPPYEKVYYAPLDSFMKAN